MKHRERVLAALSHEEPDRCPFNVAFTPEFAARLTEEVQTGPGADYNPHGAGNTFELADVVDTDFRLTSVGWSNSYYAQPGSYTDEWGVQWRSVEYTTPYGTGRYTEISERPLADDSAIQTYAPPDPGRPELYEHGAQMVRNLKDEYWIVGGVACTVFETAWALRGLDRLLMDFVVAPDLADAILDIPYNYHLAAARRLVEIGVDMVWLGDDVGAQSGMLMSPAHWRRFLKPRLASMVAALKGVNPDVRVAYHSDGDISAIIPELIEVGVDVLNPIQPACMDPAELKEQYGDRLCFWGTIDEQHTLPFGSPEDVREEVLTRLATVGKGGGLILSPTHNIQLDTPMDNFWAMVNTIRETPYASLHCRPGRGRAGGRGP